VNKALEWIRRHRTAVAALAAIFVVVLLVVRALIPGGSGG
jgi:hypothetical protein